MWRVSLTNEYKGSLHEAIASIVETLISSTATGPLGTESFQACYQKS